jgi:hypothetical protein
MVMWTECYGNGEGLSDLRSSIALTSSKDWQYPIIPAIKPCMSLKNPND